MKYLVRIIIGLAAVFAAFCAFLAVMEQVSSRMNFSQAEAQDSDKIQFDMDEIGI
jgi:sensor domain CHASE-containing protein